MTTDDAKKAKVFPTPIGRQGVQFSKAKDLPRCAIPGCDNGAAAICCVHYTLNIEENVVMSFRHCQECRLLMREQRQVRQ